MILKVSPNPEILWFCDPGGISRARGHPTWGVQLRFGIILQWISPKALLPNPSAAGLQDSCPWLSTTSILSLIPISPGNSMLGSQVLARPWALHHSLQQSQGFFSFPISLSEEQAQCSWAAWGVLPSGKHNFSSALHFALLPKLNSTFFKYAPQKIQPLFHFLITTTLSKQIWTDNQSSSFIAGVKNVFRYFLGPLRHFLGSGQVDPWQWAPTLISFSVFKTIRPWLTKFNHQRSLALGTAFQWKQHRKKKWILRKWR